MSLINYFFSIKNKTKNICGFIILILFSACFFACSNLYESNETINITLDLPLSRSNTNNERLLKASLYDKSGIVLQNVEESFFSETVNVEFSKVLVNSEIYVSVELYNDNELQFTGKSELTKIKPGKNVIKLTLIQYDDEIPDDNPEGGTGESGGGETGGSTDGNETEEPKYTPENAATKIAALTTKGFYPIEVEGNFSNSSQLSDIANAIKENTNITVKLDLSRTTGLEDVPQSCFKDCTNLTAIILPGASTTDTAYTGLKNIGYEAFSGCTGLSNITFPASLESISMNAFDGCTALEFIYYYGTKSEWDSKFSPLPDGNTALSNANFKQVYEE